MLNVIEDRLIFDLILHESLLQRGSDRNGQTVMVRPPQTAVNRGAAHLRIREVRSTRAIDHFATRTLKQIREACGSDRAART